MTKRIATTLAALAVAGGLQAQLLVAELLFQPRKGEAEYVELHNAADTAVDLADYSIVRWLGDSLGTRYPLPQHAVGPQQCVVLTKDAASVAANYTVHHPSRLVEATLPPYPNDGGKVILAKVDGTVVDSFTYSPAMHSRLLRDKAGVALERRSFDVPAHEPSNWYSASSTAGYGTPTYENSQSTELLAEESSFALSATLLSPDGDGYQDELEVSYRLDDGALTMKAEVYDSRGRMVARLANNELAGTNGTLRWDGKVGGRTVTGQYILLLTLYDTEGRRQAIKRVVNVVAR